MAWVVAYGFVLSMLIEGSKGAYCKQPSLYYTTERGIWCTGIQTDSPGVGKRVIYMPPYKGGFAYTNRPITIDVGRGKMYWQNFFRKEIHESNMDGSNQVAILSGFTGIIAGLAIDWIRGNIYFTDNLHAWIGVAYYNRSTGVGYSTVLISGGDMKRPTGIAVDPIAGYLFWVDPQKRTLERSRLDGSEHTIIMNKGVYPTDLSLNLEVKKVYWCELLPRRVCWSDYDGNHLNCYRFHYLRHHNYGRISLYSLAFYKPLGKVFLTDIQEDIIERYDVANNREDMSAYLHVRYTNILSTFYSQIRVFDASAQPQGSTPCNSNSNQCTHFCFKLTETTYRCGCPTGMKLDSNGTRCVNVSADFNMYYADHYVGKIFHVTKYKDHSGTRLDVVPNSGSDAAYPVALAYDPVDETLYWSDIGAKKIFRMRSNGLEKKEIVTKDVAKVEGLAIDHDSGLIFWTNNDRNTIEVAKLDGSHRHLLVDSDLDKPMDIVTYVERGIMFITDWGFKPKVVQMNMDGTNRKTLAGEGTNIAVRWPHGLTLDKVDNKLYYVDAYLDKIMVHDLDSGKTKVILHHGSETPLNKTYIIFRASEKLEHPFSLTLYGSYLYWSDWATGAIYQANRFEGGKIDLLAGGLFRPADIHAYTAGSITRQRRKYMFAYLTSACASECKEGMLKQIKVPECPSGYRSARNVSQCSKCNAKVQYGSNTRCECNNWASCAHRIETTSNCTDAAPYLHVGVRECIQDVKPGYCPNIRFIHCRKPTDQCTADQNCTGDQKCCKTACGNLCQPPSSVSPVPRPCQAQYKKCNICIPLPDNKHKCLCPPGQILDKDGLTCKVPMGVCARYGPCINGGSCVVAASKPKCNCTKTHTGKFCEIPLYCHSNPCVKGTCKEIRDGYECKCPPGVFGKHCNLAGNCARNICQNHGACYIDVGGSTVCNCTKEYAGDRCEFKRMCHPSPCKNGGTCKSVALESAKCICTPQYTGLTCETPTACANVSCENNGTCYAEGNDYECRCVPGHTGRRCETKLHCFGINCKNGGKCLEKRDGYQCNCVQGYIGKHCDTSTPCKGQTCSNKGSCQVRGSGFKCNCLTGYTGENCETYRHCTGIVCRNGGRCLDLGNDFKCNCTVEYMGRFCEQQSQCHGRSCNNRGMCKLATSGYKCTCLHDYTGKDCEVKINKCNGNNCASGSTCVEEIGTYRCSCAAGYTGQYCNTKLCPPCQNGGVCKTPTSAACMCPEYYIGTSCQIYIKDNVLVTVLEPKQGVTVTRQKFMNVLARGYSSVCGNQIKCFDENTVNRKRRESPVISHTFSSEDIVVNKSYPAKQSDGNFKVEFTVLKPISVTGSNARQLLSLSVIKDGFDTLKNFIEKELGVSVQTVDPIASPKKTGKRKSKDGLSVGSGAAIGIAVIFAIALIFLLLMYCKRRKSKDQLGAPPVSFSNKTFVPDVHPGLQEYSQDPRGLPMDAPPEYDGPGYGHHLPVYSASGLSYLENPTYGEKGAELPSPEIGDPYDIGALQKDEKLRVDMSPIHTDVKLNPELKGEATGFENPLYAQTQQESQENYQSLATGMDTHAPVGIYQTLNNEQDDFDQAGPLPVKKVPLDADDSTA